MKEVIKKVAEIFAIADNDEPNDGLGCFPKIKDLAAEALSLLRQQPEGKFTSQWRERLKNAETLYRMGRSADDWFGSIVSGFRESLDVLDRQGAELKLYRKNFCEAHQPLPEDTYKGCYCCDLAELAKQIEELKLKYEQYTRGKAKYYHDVWCNAGRHLPMGCGGCSCTIGHELKALRAENKELKQKLAEKDVGLIL